MGVGGAYRLEASVGRVLREQPAELITLKLGINVYGGAHLGNSSFSAAVIGLVQLIRDGYPETPIGLITPIYSVHRETETNAVGMTLEQYREHVRQVFTRLREQGDEQLVLFEGIDLLGPEEGHLLPDDLYPNGEGYELMGQRAARSILPVLMHAAGIRSSKNSAAMA